MKPLAEALRDLLAEAAEVVTWGDFDRMLEKYRAALAAYDAQPQEARLAAEIIAAQKPLPADMAEIIGRRLSDLYYEPTPAQPQEAQPSWGDFMCHEERLVAQEAQPVVPPGFKLVPVEPTQEMRAAAEEYFASTRNRAKGSWWWDRLFQAYISASPAQPVVEPVAPEGWRLVPVEPTEAMLDAVKVTKVARIKRMVADGPEHPLEVSIDRATAEDYRAMLAAAPAQPAGGVPQPDVTCPRCNGAGSVTMFDTTCGPLGEDYDTDCPRCEGAGAIAARGAQPQESGK